MARILAAMAMFFLLQPAVGCAEGELLGALNDADKAAIQKVVEGQLLALRQDDSVQAFFYASPRIQQRFRSPVKFLNMVKEAYPVVYHPRDVQLRKVESTEEGAIQQVFFFGERGEPVLGFFQMEKQEDGSWKVNGCRLTPAPDISI